MSCLIDKSRVFSINVVFFLQMRFARYLARYLARRHLGRDVLHVLLENRSDFSLNVGIHFRCF